MMTLILYCAVCYLYQVGFGISSYAHEHYIAIFSIILAPIVTPMEIGGFVYIILHKQNR